MGGWSIQILERFAIPRFANQSSQHLDDKYKMLLKNIVCVLFLRYHCAQTAHKFSTLLLFLRKQEFY